jgi:hypothetical protein
MPKRSKAPNLADLFPTNKPPGGTPDLPHELTAATWARVFAITLERLRRANPGWAAITAMQVTNLQTSWAAKRQRLSQPEREQWLEEALTYMHTRPPWRMKSTGRATQGPTDRWLLMARQWKPGEVVVGKEDVGASARKRVPRHKLSYRKARNPLEAWIDEISPPPKPR